MLKLRDRQKQIPYGMKFFQPQTGWKAPDYASFDTIVDGLIAHRSANPYLAQKFNWRTDRRGVEAEVEDYNAQICKAMGWTAYIVGDESFAPPPLPKPGPLPRPVAVGAKIGSGVEALAWLGENGVPVAPELSEKRAAVCALCPMNEQGDWTRFFTVPAAALIKYQMEKRAQMKLSTSHDEQLRVCGACLCPLKLKVHVELPVVVKHLTAEQRSKLDPGCWILSESK